MFPCHCMDRIDLRFCDLPCKGPGMSLPVLMDMQHDPGGLDHRLMKNGLKDMNDKIHGRIVVVQEEYGILRRLLQLQVSIVLTALFFLRAAYAHYNAILSQDEQASLCKKKH